MQEVLIVEDEMNDLTLRILDEVFAVFRMDKSELIPEWAINGTFFSVTRTYDELSIVCSEENVPELVKCEKGWRSFKVEGCLDFGLVGVLNSITEPLALAQISVFVMSTYDTDYIMVKEDKLPKAILILQKAGFIVTERK